LWRRQCDSGDEETAHAPRIGPETSIDSTTDKYSIDGLQIAHHFFESATSLEYLSQIDNTTLTQRVVLLNFIDGYL
jgi:hypothetical protein